MANPYASVSFWNPQDQRQYDQYNAMAGSLQQQAANPQVDNRGQESWTQGMAQVAQALAANQLRQKADKLAQNKSMMPWAGADSGGAFG